MSQLHVDEYPKRRLDPWPVIVANLFKLDSYDIPAIVDKSGMMVEWRLKEPENYSHRYRKAAYRPRVNEAYEALNEDDRLRVALVLCEELALEGMADRLDADLQRIGWRIHNTTLVPTSETVRELFFPQGTQHDAYVQIKGIFLRASQSIRIVDPYVDGSIFTMLSSIENALEVGLLGAQLSADVKLEANKFRRQYSHMKVEIRRSERFHDRFIIIDGIKCWHLGCSIKDAGNKAFMLSLIEDKGNAEALLHTLDTTWASATPV